MVKRTVLKVNLSCHKCKTKVLKAVSGIQGVDKVEVDGANGTLTVTGDADPCEITKKTRKAGKCAEMVSVGPPQGPPKKPEPEPAPEPAPEPSIEIIPLECPICSGMPVMARWEELGPKCSIL